MPNFSIFPCNIFLKLDILESSPITPKSGLLLGAYLFATTCPRKQGKNSLPSLWNDSQTTGFAWKLGMNPRWGGGGKESY